MNLIDIYLPMIIVSYRKKKLDKIFATEFPGKSKVKEDLDIHYFVESQCIL
jgi:hypothetical protein